jgi:hypothetical protein
MAHNYTAGISAENYLASLLNAKGIKYTYSNGYYDFLINDKIKLEVKSCYLNNSKGKDPYHRAGRFSFSIKETTDRLYNEDVWICFILRYKGDFMLLGFCRARKLNKKRFVGLHQIDLIGVISFEDWLKEILK